MTTIPSSQARLSDDMSVEITETFYSLQDLDRICSGRQRITLSSLVERNVSRGAEYVASISGEDRSIYGVNTGFGSLCETRIVADQLSELQHRHLLSHACGVGEPAPEQICRMAMLLKIIGFRTGHSGISLHVLRRLVDLWNNDVTPVIPKKGTVGASGDLSPLAHLALPLVGLGKVWLRGAIAEAADALRQLGLEPLRLGPKEGLALTNGVQYINAWGARALLRAHRLILDADLLASLSMQGFSTARTFYQEILHGTSHHPERATVAANLRTLLDGSNHYRLPQCNRAQEDPYSFRCVPQVHAAVRQTYMFARTLIERECNSVSDNPLIFPEQDAVLTGGNLHGESTAFALDYMAIAMSELASISERRTYQLLSGQHALPDFLVAEPGLNSGLMIIQYTAAALVNENKVLATPASIDTIPTCQLQEDHVSMGGTSAYKLWQILDNLETVQAIELLAAMQAIDLAPGLRLSGHAQRIHDAFRGVVDMVTQDRLMSTDIERAGLFMRQSPVLKEVRQMLE